MKGEIIFCSTLKADFVSFITHTCISSCHNINFVLLFFVILAQTAVETDSVLCSAAEVESQLKKHLKIPVIAYL